MEELGWTEAEGGWEDWAWAAVVGAGWALVGLSCWDGALEWLQCRRMVRAAERPGKEAEPSAALQLSSSLLGTAEESPLTGRTQPDGPPSFSSPALAPTAEPLPEPSGSFSSQSSQASTAPTGPSSASQGSRSTGRLSSSAEDAATEPPTAASAPTAASSDGPLPRLSTDSNTLLSPSN